MDTNQPQGNYYIIADHLRTAIFALADGAHFEPKGRGYILKKLVKRATLIGYFLNFSADDLLLFSKKIIEINRSFYSHLREKENLIMENLTQEINYTLKFITNSTHKIDHYCQGKPVNTVIPAEKVFFWYDTAGIPLELIEYHLKQKEYSFSSAEFNQLLTAQKQRGKEDRASKKIAVF
ncbi:14186_t:CDS:1 [Funneliformis geosporum]|nr:14186_t:CDS:1 [Funneliformis geosporum]